MPGAITSYAIPSSVTTIGYAAFLQTGLTTITIPSTVTSIGSSAFQSCSNLVGVTMASATPPALPATSYAFSYEASGFQIHVPDAAAVTAYQGAAGWSDYSAAIVTP